MGKRKINLHCLNLKHLNGEEETEYSMEKNKIGKVKLKKIVHCTIIIPIR